MTSLLRNMFTLCLLAAALSAQAAPVYKSTMPDGKVIYGPQPAPGAKKVETLTPNTQPSGVRITTPEQKRRLDERQAEQQSEKTQRTANIEQLRAALRQAEEARDGGKEVRDGDTTGNAKGKARLNEDYFERQKSLEQAVQDARKKLEEAEHGK